MRASATPPAERHSVPRQRARSRAGRCYDLAFKMMMRPDLADGWTLIHGSVRVGVPEGKYVLLARGGHAWLERGCLIYDPVLDIFDICARGRIAAAAAPWYMLLTRRFRSWNAAGSWSKLTPTLRPV